MDRQFGVVEPDRVWTGDITYIATDEDSLFLAVVIDLFSRKVVGWALRDDMTRDIVIEALRMAGFARHPGKHAGLMFHSERGNQYASQDFRAVLEELAITGSMGRRSNYRDNACSETLFGSLKVGRLSARAGRLSVQPITGSVAIEENNASHQSLVMSNFKLTRSHTNT